MIPPSDRRTTRRGYTIVETMVVLTMMGILMSIAAPSFRRAIEQSRLDLAAANLRSIWTAERLYWLKHHHTFASDLGVLAGQIVNVDGELEELIDPSILDRKGFYSYAISSDDGFGMRFTVSAERINNTTWNSTLAIDQTGTLSGGLQAPGESPINPIPQ